MDPDAPKPIQHKNYCTAFMDATSRTTSHDLGVMWEQKVSGATEFLSAVYVTSDNTKWNQVVAECAMLKKEVCQKEQLKEEIEYMHQNAGNSGEKLTFRNDVKLAMYYKDMA